MTCSKSHPYFGDDALELRRAIKLRSRSGIRELDLQTLKLFDLDQLLLNFLARRKDRPTFSHRRHALRRRWANSA
jgi:hypothetical protein